MNLCSYVKFLTHDSNFYVEILLIAEMKHEQKAKKDMFSCWLSCNALCFDRWVFVLHFFFLTQRSEWVLQAPPVFQSASRRCWTPALTSLPFHCRPKHEEVGRRLLAHRAPLCQTNSVTLKYLPKNRFWRKDESDIVGKFCSAPLPLGNK